MDESQNTSELLDKDGLRFKVWLDQVCARPMPSDKIARVKTLARELAEGAVQEFWSVQHLSQRVRISYVNRISRLSKDETVNFEEILVSPNWVRGFRIGTMETHDDGVRESLRYFLRRWDFECARPALLRAYGYLDEKNTLTKSAFELLSLAISSNLFISYHRRESSALGLLIVARMKTVGLEPFIDMALLPGEAWRTSLQTRIKTYDSVILLLSANTLNSEYVLREIEWALEASVPIIPVWHNGFVYRREDWQGKLPATIADYLANTHTIRVLEESASGYNTAIVELLNRFGVTPD